MKNRIINFGYEKYSFKYGFGLKYGKHDFFINLRRFITKKLNICDCCFKRNSNKLQIENRFLCKEHTVWP